MKKHEKGDKIPGFELYNQNQKLFRLSEHLNNKNSVIYFYPKDGTPGVTAEACGFRDHFETVAK
jgi:peroxiredoxin Q/BCP